MKRLFIGIALTLAAAGQNAKRNTFIIEIPVFVHGTSHVDYIKVIGTDRLDALAHAGMTVFTQADWDETLPKLCAHTPKALFCDPANISDRTTR